MRGESVSTDPRRPEAEALSNAVDVLERLRDPTEAEGEFRQHDSVVTVMMNLPTQGFA